MRVALIHSFYSSLQPSGENSVVRDQALALHDAGHDVLLVARETDQEQLQGLYPLRTALTVASGYGYNPSEELRAFGPDVVHIHNLFPNFGTRWIDAWAGPIVQSVHNYRFTCANGLLYRAGGICTECPGKGMHRSVVHACYRHSPLATLPLALSRRRDGLEHLRRVAAVVTTSQYSDTAVRRLVTNLKTELIPNFVEGPAIPSTGARSGRWIALGRMTPEKGLLELVRDWPNTETLDIVGEGPLYASIMHEAAGRPIKIQRTVPRERMRQLLAQAEGLIFPSRWWEVAPQVVVEAMRLGLPTIAHSLNGVSSFVQETQTGLTYFDSRSLKSALMTVREHRDRFSENALRNFQLNWSRDVWTNSIVALYRRLASDASG